MAAKKKGDHDDRVVRSHDELDVWTTFAAQALCGLLSLPQYNKPAGFDPSSVAAGEADHMLAHWRERKRLADQT